MKKCLVCQKNFILYNNNQKYCSKECYKINLKNRKKFFYQKNKDKIKRYYINYWKLNKKKINKQQKEYNKQHEEEKKEYFRNYVNNKRKINISYKILCNLRVRLYHVLKSNFKSQTTLQFLGCSLEFLKQYLQKQFKSKMNWNNYGKWEIDHIRPCCAFNLVKKSEQKKCFHYTNLQPLWKSENRIKQGKT
jgi:predicted nucleic acid-binding Zn ribbon protein